ncbi:hypothetical protein DPEC_G00043340 [Dallia pectoralis]|uniref:Uncharacterized protein n=1 Tax=Dallia pectoralis TaxID=75939 RepID=A0ACC2H933_DALPE|nr:hypothetical protein DPEC_G00043340 [Dallia pectoralis]
MGVMESGFGLQKPVAGYSVYTEVAVEGRGSDIATALQFVPHLRWKLSPLSFFKHHLVSLHGQLALAPHLSVVSLRHFRVAQLCHFDLGLTRTPRGPPWVNAVRPNTLCGRVDIGKELPSHATPAQAAR